MTVYTETNQREPVGKGSSKKQMYDIIDEPQFCFIVIPADEEKKLDHELNNYEILRTYGVRIPIIKKNSQSKLKKRNGSALRWKNWKEWNISRN